MRAAIAVACVQLSSVLVLVAGCRTADEGDGEEREGVETEVAVEVAKVVRTTLHGYLDAYGSVVAEPAASGRPAGAALLAAPVAGLVMAVPVSEGESVKTGDLVVRLDDRIPKAEVARARATVAFAEQALARETTLLAQQNTSQRQHERARESLSLARAELSRAQGSLAQVQLRSPLDGMVASIHARPGQSVDPNTVVAEIVDLHRLAVAAMVPAEAATAIKPGQHAQVSAGSRTSAATVSYVHPTVDPDTGTVLVRLALSQGSELQPGTFTRVRIEVQERTDCLAVPRGSVFITPDGRGTLSIVEGHVAHTRAAQVGLQDRGLIEVEAAGLEQGMTVVTVGAYALPDKTRVRVVSAGAEQPGR